MLTIDDYQIDIQQAFYENDQTVIYKCEKTSTKEKYLCKVLPIENNFPDSLNELEVLKIIQKEQHMNIVKIYQIKYKFGFAYVFMESFIQNLEQFLKSRVFMNSEDVCSIISQIVNGYKQLRKLKIVLRNLNLSSIYMNIVQGQFLFKITDFTFSHFLDQNINSKAESLYFAPEVLNMNNNQNYNEQCDVYSLGILIYRLFFQGSFPLQIKDFDQLKTFHQSIKNFRFVCPRNNNIPQELVKLIEGLIIYDPFARMIWDQIEIHPQLGLNYFIWKEKYFINFSSQIDLGIQCPLYSAINLETNEKIFARKILSKESQSSLRIYNNLVGKNNENVLQVLQIIVDDYFSYIIMEQGDINLQQYFEKNRNFFQEQEILNFIRQISNGYCFLRDLNVTHCLLNLQNIFIKFDQNKNKVVYKILFERIDNYSINQNRLNFLMFQAPEIHSGAESNEQSDIFSLGLIIYNLTFQQHLFAGLESTQIIQSYKILSRSSIRCPDNQIPELKQLIEGMLQYKIESRTTWEQLKNQIKQCSKQQIREQINRQDEQQQSNQEIKKQQDQNSGQQNIQNELIKKQEIQLFDYILAIIDLGISLIDASEIYLQNNFNFNAQIGYLNLFLIKFCEVAFHILDQLHQKQSTFLFDKNYEHLTINKIDERELLSKVYQKKREREIKIENFIQNLPQSEQKLKAYQDYIEINKKLRPNKKCDIKQVHACFEQYYLNNRSQFQQPHINLDFRYLLEKMKNLFREYDITQPIYYSKNDINPNIKQLFPSFMENYIQQQI